MKNPTDGVTVWVVYIGPGTFPRLIIGKDCELDVQELWAVTYFTDSQHLQNDSPFYWYGDLKFKPLFSTDKCWDLWINNHTGVYSVEILAGQDSEMLYLLM